jgi:biotin carboxyl carrier protein
MKLTIDGHEYDVSAAGDSVTVNGKSFDTKVEGEGPQTTVVVNGRRYKVHRWTHALPVPPAHESLAKATAREIVDEEVAEAASASATINAINVDGKIYRVQAEGLTRAAAKPAPKKRSQSAAAPGAVTALMPGRVVRVEVEEGQTVDQGQVLLVLEAMKMENEILAEVSGTVKQIAVSKGTAVAAGDTLIVIE